MHLFVSLDGPLGAADVVREVALLELVPDVLQLVDELIGLPREILDR